MFGFGIWELLVIVIVALLVLGPEKLPEMARTVGKGLRELRRASNDLQNSLHEAVYADEIKQLREKYRAPDIKAALGIEPLEGGPLAQPAPAAAGPATPGAADATAKPAPGSPAPAGGAKIEPAPAGPAEAPSAPPATPVSPGREEG